MTYSTFSSLVDEAVKEWVEDQESDAPQDEIWLDMAAAIISSGSYEEHGFTEDAAKAFAKAHGLTWPY